MTVNRNWFILELYTPHPNTTYLDSYIDDKDTSTVQYEGTPHNMNCSIDNTCKLDTEFDNELEEISSVIETRTDAKSRLDASCVISSELCTSHNINTCIINVQSVSVASDINSVIKIVTEFKSDYIFKIYNIRKLE